MGTGKVGGGGEQGLSFFTVSYTFQISKIVSFFFVNTGSIHTAPHPPENFSAYALGCITVFYASIRRLMKLIGSCIVRCKLFSFLNFYKFICAISSTVRRLVGGLSFIACCRGTGFQPLVSFVD